MELGRIVMAQVGTDPFKWRKKDKCPYCLAVGELVKGRHMPEKDVAKFKVYCCQKNVAHRNWVFDPRFAYWTERDLDNLGIKDREGFRRLLENFEKN